MLGDLRSPSPKPAVLAQGAEPPGTPTGSPRWGMCCKRVAHFLWSTGYSVRRRAGLVSTPACGMERQDRRADGPGTLLGPEGTGVMRSLGQDRPPAERPRQAALWFPEFFSGSVRTRGTR
jgi:hypothetical protein